jgi:isopentenyldiphosphate isomerase
MSDKVAVEKLKSLVCGARLRINPSETNQSATTHLQNLQDRVKDLPWIMIPWICESSLHEGKYTKDHVVQDKRSQHGQAVIVA